MTGKVNLGQFSLAINDNEREARPMVFVHGLPTSKELFTPLARVFKEDYRTICVDFLDYGESSRIERHIEHKERAENLKALFETLILKDVILVCHDLGASVVMDFMALAQERISALIIMSPPVFPDFREPAVVKLVRSRLIGPVLIFLTKNYLLQRSIEKGLVNSENYGEYLRSPLEKAFEGKSGSRALLRNLRWGRPHSVFTDYPRIMDGIRQPTLIIQGMEDPYIPLEHAQRLSRTIRNAELTLMENAAHFLPIDVPKELGEVIVRFLKEKEKTISRQPS